MDVEHVSANKSPVTDSHDQSPSVAVVEAVAEASDRDPTEMEPLYDAIEPDALNALCAHATEPNRDEVVVTFTYSGYRVRVSNSTDVFVLPIEE